MPLKSRKKAINAAKHRKLTEQTLNLDSNRQYKQTEPQEDEREAEGLLYLPRGHERNCHRWSCPVLNKSKDMKNKERHIHTKPVTFNWFKKAVGCLGALSDSMVLVLTSTHTQSLIPSFISNRALGSLATCLLQFKSNHIEAVASLIDSLLFTSGSRCHVEEVLMSRAFSIIFIIVNPYCAV